MANPKSNSQRSRDLAKGEIIARGLEKIRQFHLQKGNTIVIPMGSDEHRETLTRFQDEFNDNDGVMASDHYMLINQMTGGAADKITELWTMMLENEVDMNGIEPTEQQLTEGL